MLIERGISAIIDLMRSKNNKPKGYWTVERASRLAKKYDYVTDFRHENPSAYRVLRGAELLGSFFNAKKPRVDYSKKNFIKIAFECESRRKMRERSYSIYMNGLNKGWVDEVFPVKGDERKVFIYIITHLDREELRYVGISKNPSSRMVGHKKRGSVFKWIKDAGIDPERLVMNVSKYSYSEEIAKRTEIRLIKYFRLRNIKLINMSNGGELGSVDKKWDIQSVTKEAKNYRSRKEFSCKCSAGYSFALKNGLLDDLFGPKLHKEWSVESVKAEACKYSSVTEFQRGSGGAYNFALREGIVRELFSSYGPKKKWDKDKIKQECSKYNSRSELRTEKPSLYKKALKAGVLHECIPHKYKEWTLLDIETEASKYNTRNEWAKNSSNSYAAASRRGSVDKIWSSSRKERATEAALST